MPRPSRYAPDTLTRPWHWADDAACAGLETERFFPLGKGTEAAAAKAVCRPCPVRSACLAHALTRREDDGVWGGLDESERAVLIRDGRRAAERQRRKERARANASPSA